MGHKERELIGVLGDAGFAAMRAPASGAATADDLPDVLAGRPHIIEGEDPPGLRVSHYAEVYAVEAKYRSKPRVYLPEDEVAALRAFSAAFGAWPKVGVRWNASSGSFAQGDTDWYFADPYNIPKSKGGSGESYVVTYEDMTGDEWKTVGEL